jgi:hypothetical protein
LARRQYYRAQFSCDEGQALKEEIKNYVNSVRFFFSSSFIKPMKINVRTQFDLMFALMKRTGLYTPQYESLPTLHPLFSQVIQQILVEVFPAGSSDSVKNDFIAKRLGISKERPDSTFLQFIAQLDDFFPGGLSPMGLWPSANFSIYGQIQRTRMKLLAELAPDLKISSFNGLAFGAFMRLPEFYFENKSKLVDETRAMNQRYGVAF